jgi:hypothetical protein
MPSIRSDTVRRCGCRELDEAKPLRHAMHVDVSVAREHVEARLEAERAAGGRVVDESEERWTLADRAGNRVCICAWPDGSTAASGRSRSACSGLLAVPGRQVGDSRLIGG